MDSLKSEITAFVKKYDRHIGGDRLLYVVASIVEAHKKFNLDYHCEVLSNNELTEYNRDIRISRQRGIWK